MNNKEMIFTFKKLNRNNEIKEVINNLTLTETEDLIRKLDYMEYNYYIEGKAKKQKVKKKKS